MINVSDEFKTLMQSDNHPPFKQNAVITTADGTEITLTEADFTIDNNDVTDAAGANSLPLGTAMSRTIQIELMNDDGRYADVAFIGAKIRLYLTFQLSETVEKIEYGTFTVIEPETYGETVIISAVDDMHKADTEYTTELAFPQTVAAVFRDACELCGILIGSSDFINNDYVVQKKPEGKTCREIIGYVAQIAAGNARIDRYGSARIITYDLSDISVGENVTTSGGTFNPWTTGTTINGGTFNPWTTAEVLSGGTFIPWNDGNSGSGGGVIIPNSVHDLRRWINLKLDTDDIVITGIQTIKRTEDSEGNTTENTIIYGAEGYVLVIDNPLIEGNEEIAIQGIGNVLIGGRIRKFSGDHVAYPLAEFGDKAVIFDRKGNWYQTVLTDINFRFFGMTTLSNSAADALRNSSKYNSAAAQAVIAAKELVKKEKTQRELAVEKLNETLAKSSGMYSTEELQPDGSTIYYLHDKPTIAESQNVMKLTAEAIGFSTDGGETYPFGFTLNGEMVMSIIATEGLNADWINTGALVVKDANGKIVFQADVDSGTVVIDTDYFTLDAQGRITAKSGQFSGEIESTSGTIGGWTIGDDSIYTENGFGAKLNSNGHLIAGALDISGAGNGIATLTVGDVNIMMQDSNGVQKISLGANGNGEVEIGVPTTFAHSATFQKMPTFPEAIPVTSGGTGATSFTKTSVLLGNGENPFMARPTFDGAFYATESGGLPSFGTLPIAQGGTGATDTDGIRTNIGVRAGSVSITPSTSTYVDSASISLPGVSDYAITVTPHGSTGVPMTCAVRNNGSDAFFVRVYPVSTWSSGSWTFDWIAVKKL